MIDKAREIALKVLYEVNKNNAYSNIALDEAVIGTLAYKFGNIELKHSDIIKYMTEYTNNVEVKMTDDRYIAKRI